MIINYTKKILALSLIFMLGTVGFPWHNTLAYFSDTETAEQNTFALGSLDFSLASTTDFAPAVTPTQHSFREIALNNDGTLDFQYRAEINNIGGNSDLCDALNLSVSLASTPVYNGPLANFELATSTDLGTFNFETNLTDSALALQNKTCTFDFVYTGWQDNLPDESAGFFDIETISNTVQSGSWNGVVLNEILPNPEGDDDQVGLQGEWVEFYNNSDQAVDLDGWYIEDASSSGHRQTISSQTTFNGRTTIGVPGSGLEWVVLFMNGNILNNTGDTVTLYDASDNMIDSYTFTGSGNDTDSDSNNTPGGDNQNPTGDETASNEGKSYARIPDGIGEWVDPIPTPGGANELVITSQATYLDLTQSTEQSVSTSTPIVEIPPEETATSTSTPIVEIPPEETATSTSTPVVEIPPEETTTSTSTPVVEIPPEETVTEPIVATTDSSVNIPVPDSKVEPATEPLKEPVEPAVETKIVEPVEPPVEEVKIVTEANVVESTVIEEPVEEAVSE